MLKNIRFLRKKLAQAAATAPQPTPREIPEIKGTLPRKEPYYHDGKFPLRHSAPRMMPPIEKMPPKPPGANRKK